MEDLQTSSNVVERLLGGSLQSPSVDFHDSICTMYSQFRVAIPYLVQTLQNVFSHCFKLLVTVSLLGQE